MKNLNYGVIGNCRTAALISEDASIDWLCFPMFDSPSVFSKLLDNKKGGSFSIEVSPNYKHTQSYVNSTNILCTRFVSEEGSFEILDFMPRYRTANRDHHTPPELCRYMRPLSGKPRFRIRYNPIMNYGKENMTHLIFDEYIRSFSQTDGNNNMYLYSSISYQKILESSEIELVKEEFLLLSYFQKLDNVNIERMYLEYQRTKVYWLDWNSFSHKIPDYEKLVTRSLLTLKLMCYEYSGAVLAALTTSLPETIGEERNWDYRFCWIRDASMSIETLSKMGHRFTACRYLTFIKRCLRSKGDSFQIMYGINGERVLTEESLPHLSGYENSQPVRIGNAAYNQKQNDIFGHLMNIIDYYFLHFPGRVGEMEEMWEVVRLIVKSVYGVWKLPDRGIWEIRNEEKHFVFSKLMCWVALDRGVKIASYLKQPAYETAWKLEADKIKEDIMQNGWNEKLGTFTQAYGYTDVDSSLLLMAHYGFIDAHDERFVKTVHYIRKELSHEGLMYRYKNKDDFGHPTSAFTICTFWLIQALYEIDEKKEAKMIFEELLSHANHLGLFSEDLDFKTKRLLGNFPQAYSHLALINAARMFAKDNGILKILQNSI